MPKPQFIKDEVYHIYNRGVEKRKIFLDNRDYFRFIHDLFEFNNEEPTFNTTYYFNPKSMNADFQYPEKRRKPRKLLVEILIFTLMPNHFHLVLKQRKEKGIVKFMQKLGTGYTMYFNQKYERVGGLFQGSFKAVHVNKEAHLFHLPFYIHTNPLELNYGGLTSINYLKEYRWSSFLDYIGKKNFPSVTSREFILKIFGGEKEYEKITKEWLKEKVRNLKKIQGIILEN